MALLQLQMSHRNGKKVTKSVYIWKAVGLVVISLALIFGVRGFDVVREYISRANSEPANIVIDTQGVIGPLPRPWRNLAQGGEDHGWRLQPLVAQVKAIHPEYIRIDHLYDFYDIVQGVPGNLSFNFTKLDGLLDDIKATGAKPYISLSYMPPVISSGDIVAPPQRYEDWQLTVQKTIEHISGARNTPDVYYEVWNEPDLFGGWKYYGERNYLTLYEFAAKGAQNARVSQPFKIGGPAITALYKNWFDALAKHVIANNLRFDFFSWHRYDTDINRYKQDMFEVQSWIEAYPQLKPTVEFHITEWGHDSKNNAGYDNSFGAAHTAAASIEMIGVIDRAFAFEIQDGKDPAGKAQWGRWGLFTHGDFGSQPKPRYKALTMLELLGPERLQTLGKGTYVKAIGTKVNDQSFQVLLANYDPQARNVEAVPVTFQNLVPGNYQVTKIFLNKQRETTTASTVETNLQLTIPMGPSEVALIQIDKQ
jgi:hypothetical protein